MSEGTYDLGLPVRPKLKLLGLVGAASILAAARRALEAALRQAGYRNGELDEAVGLFVEAAEGDYNHLLVVVMDNFEVE